MMSIKEKFVNEIKMDFERIKNDFKRPIYVYGIFLLALLLLFWFIIPKYFPTIIDSYTLDILKSISLGGFVFVFVFFDIFQDSKERINQGFFGKSIGIILLSFPVLMWIIHFLLILGYAPLGAWTFLMSPWIILLGLGLSGMFQLKNFRSLFYIYLSPLHKRLISIVLVIFSYIWIAAVSIVLFSVILAMFNNLFNTLDNPNYLKEGDEIAKGLEDYIYFSSATFFSS